MESLLDAFRDGRYTKLLAEIEGESSLTFMRNIQYCTLNFECYLDVPFSLKFLLSCYQVFALKYQFHLLLQKSGLLNNFLKHCALTFLQKLQVILLVLFETLIFKEVFFRSFYFMGYWCLGLDFQYLYHQIHHLNHLLLGSLDYRSKEVLPGLINLRLYLRVKSLFQKLDQSFLVFQFKILKSIVLLIWRALIILHLMPRMVLEP